jgi:predicted dehydrogenase
MGIRMVSVSFVVEEVAEEGIRADGGTDLAADKEVDLVICSTRVDRHRAPVAPSLLASKTTYVEWPLEASLSLASSVSSLAAQHNATTIVGLQASFSPVIRKMKALIDDGRLGRVVSSTWQGALDNAGGVEGKNVRYFTQRAVGGNVITIGVGHTLEFLTHGISQLYSGKGSGLTSASAGGVQKLR